MTQCESLMEKKLMEKRQKLASNQRKGVELISLIGQQKVLYDINVSVVLLGGISFNSSKMSDGEMW